LHDRLLQLNNEITGGIWAVKEYKNGPRSHVKKMTGMDKDIDWSNVALSICGGSAALAVAFILAANEEIKKYLIKKGEIVRQDKIDIEGFRFGLRCQDHHVNQVAVSMGKTPKHKFGLGFATTKNAAGKIVPTTCAPPVAGSSDTSKNFGGDPAAISVPPVSSTGVAPGGPSSSNPVVASGSQSNVTRASSSTTAPSTASAPSSNVAHLATIIQNAARPSIDYASALQIATMIENSVENAVMEAANIPGLTAEMVQALTSSSQLNLPRNFNVNIGASSGATHATQSDTTGASSSASVDTGSETTASASSGASNKKKKRPAVKKGGRRR
jgi:hypothetical protein